MPLICSCCGKLLKSSNGLLREEALQCGASGLLLFVRSWKIRLLELKVENTRFMTIFIECNLLINNAPQTGRIGGCEPIDDCCAKMRIFYISLFVSKPQNSAVYVDAAY